MSDVAPEYEFGPREHRGLAGGPLRGGQIVLLSIAFLALGSIVSIHTPIAIALLGVLAVGSSAAAFVPVEGKPLDRWIPVLITWGLRRVSRRHRWANPIPMLGRTVKLDYAANPVSLLAIEEVPAADECQPPAVKGLRLITWSPVDWEGLGVGIIEDGRGRSRTWTAVLSVEGSGFVLRSLAEKAGLIEDWGGIISGLRDRPISRIQYSIRAIPEASSAMERHFDTHASESPLLENARRSYLDLLASSGPITQQYEGWIALQVDLRRSAGLIVRQGRGDIERGACEVLLGEVASLAQELTAVGLRVLGARDPRSLAEVIRGAYEPDMRRRRAALERQGAEAGIDPRRAWPSFEQEELGHVRTASGFHATYHVAEYPREPVGPSFLEPLLLRTDCARVLSTTLELQSSEMARREVRSQRMTDRAAAQIRGHLGFEEDERHQRERENVDRRAAKLADGHVMVTYSSYLTVTATSREELDAACAEVERKAREARCELERLWGEQSVALTFTLPFCRGL